MMKTTGVFIGLMLGMISGVLAGSSASFLKKMHTWAWENIWLAYSVWALFLLPVIWGWLTVPKLWTVLTSVPPGTFLVILLCGVGWGLSTIGYALGIRDIGLALTTVIILGIGNALGSLLPLLLFHPESLFKPAGIMLSGGVAITILGIATCSTAALQTEKYVSNGPRRERRFIKKAMIRCVLAGFLSILFNLGLIFGQPVARKAVSTGAATQNAANATWIILLGGSFSVMLIYCLRLLWQKNSFSLFGSPKAKMNWLYAFLMGFVWLGGVNLYGLAVINLGQFGPSIGWPIFQSMQIAAANFWGAVTGEWRGAVRQVNRLRIAGLLILFLGIAIIGSAGRL